MFMMYVVLCSVYIILLVLILLCVSFICMFVLFVITSEPVWGREAGTLFAKSCFLVRQIYVQASERWLFIPPFRGLALAASVIGWLVGWLVGWVGAVTRRWTMRTGLGTLS